MPSSPYAQAPYDGGTGTPRLTHAVLWLLALNVAVYFVQETVQQNLDAYLGFRGVAGLLEFEWWTLATYAFVHAGFWHLAFNMYALWAFGPRLEAEWGGRAFTAYYLWCGLGGAAAHALFVREPSVLVGASGAVLGVLLAFALRWPDEEVLFFGLVPMKMRWYAAFIGAISIVGSAIDVASGGGSGVSNLAHLGGLVFGGLWLLRPAAPDVERFRQRVSPAPDVPDGLPRAIPPRSTPRPRERGSAADEAVERSRALTTQPPPTGLPTMGPPAPPRDVPPSGRPRPARAAERGAVTPPGGPPGAAPVVATLPASTAAARREVLDRLLDKISANGIESLTGDERRLLEETSRSLRDQ
jgi:membrane associated rhomboid family serine protease